MESSEEICRIVDRWLVAARDGDADTFIGKISEHAGVLVIGSDAEEWWHREDDAVWRRQLEESGGFPFSWGEIEAWEEGTVGWAGAKLTIAGPEETYPFRVTWVLHLELGEWKIVQMHFSAGRSNLELLGQELTVSLEQLEQTIRRERPDLTGTLAADGTVTIVFTDIVDSTVLTTRLGDRAWLDALRRHNEVIRETAAAHGGTVVETQGDGSMLAFSSARRAVRSRGRGAGFEPRARAGCRLGHRLPREPRGRAQRPRGLAAALRRRPRLARAEPKHGA